MQPMRFELTNPALQKYVADKVSAGEFASPEAVVEDALTRAMNDDAELSPEDWEAIRQGDEEIERGEFVEWREFSAKLRARHGIEPRRGERM
jgi:hypothetical protein